MSTLQYLLTFIENCTQFLLYNIELDEYTVNFIYIHLELYLVSTLKH